MKKKIKPELNMDFFNRIREEIRKREKMDDRSHEERARDTKMLIMAFAADGPKWQITLISNANEGLIDFTIAKLIHMKLKLREASGNLTPMEIQALKHFNSHDDESGHHH